MNKKQKSNLEALEISWTKFLPRLTQVPQKLQTKLTADIQKLQSYQTKNKMNSLGISWPPEAAIGELEDLIREGVLNNTVSYTKKLQTMVKYYKKLGTTWGQIREHQNKMELKKLDLKNKLLQLAKIATELSQYLILFDLSEEVRKNNE